MPNFDVIKDNMSLTINNGIFFIYFFLFYIIYETECNTPL